MLRIRITLALSTLFLASICSAQQASTTAVPNLIRYGGVLKDAHGAALSSATTGVTFAIYKQQDGGAPVWMETQNVATDATGNYSVLLGSTTATGLPSDLFSQEEQRWLGVQVQGQAEQPRVLLVSVPYAFKAHEAETLGGRSISDFVLAKDANPSANGGNTSQPGSSTAISSSTTKAGIKTGGASQGPTNFSGSTTDQIVGVTQSGMGAGVNAIASGNAVEGTATASNGYGLFGIATSSGGFGVLGESRASSGGGIGVKGSSSSTSGTGMRGIATAATGTTTGVSSYVASPAGTAAVFNNAAGGKIISGHSNGTEHFSVDGSGNVNLVGGAYQIGGSSVLSIGGNVADDNLFLGVGAGANNYGQAYEGNTFSGYQAGYSNTRGYFNAFYGDGAGYSNNSGNNNTFIGDGAGNNNTQGNSNVFTGAWAGYSNTTGSYNTFSGDQAGHNNAGASGNTFSGYQSGLNNTGAENTFTGYQTGLSNSGGGNIFYGFKAGLNNTTGSNDIYIGNEGPSSGTESNTMRIGTQGTGDGEQNATYIAGIYGSTSSSGVPVYINSDSKLGTLTSSLRFKEQVRDMGDSTSALMKLRPVTFLYKPEYDKGERTLQYGLIAEEVAKVYPELVAYDNDGQPYTVRYQYITTMLLNEVQKQCHRADAQAEVIKAQERKIDELEQRLSRLESLVSQTVAQK